MSDAKRPPWHFESPLCAEVGTEIFYPPDKNDPDSGRMWDTTREAKKICQSCEHIHECRLWAILNEPHGIWGGMSPRERQRERRKLGVRMYNRSTHPYEKHN